MKGLIDTIFNPLLNWLNDIQSYLSSASIPLSQQLPLNNLFSPIAMISPQYALLISNIFVMAFVYGVIFIVSNGAGMIERFRNTVKWW